MLHGPYRCQHQLLCENVSENVTRMVSLMRESLISACFTVCVSATHPLCSNRISRTRKQQHAGAVMIERLFVKWKLHRRPSLHLLYFLQPESADPCSNALAQTIMYNCGAHLCRSCAKRNVVARILPLIAHAMCDALHAQHTFALGLLHMSLCLQRTLNPSKHG